MKNLNKQQIEGIKGGNACGYTTGGMCFATIALLSSAFFAPLAAATGIGCAIGVASGCAS